MGYGLGLPNETAIMLSAINAATFIAGEFIAGGVQDSPNDLVAVGVSAGVSTAAFTFFGQDIGASLGISVAGAAGGAIVKYLQSRAF